MSSTMPSALASGRYQLGQLIGRGGMAEVHVALDTRLGRTVAIKIMRADLATDNIFLKRFRREAHAVAQMNNPNIVNIYDSGEEVVEGPNGTTETLPYIVMEYIKGQTLRDIIKVNGALSQRDSEMVMLGVLGALDYSHRMGVIHRDIKPGNIMISEQGVVKVMDFGIARALDDSAATMTQSQGVVGTAQYLSPEQARGETVDMRSDLYSAGCVLYEMLTGRPPFTGDSAVAIAYQHVSEIATPPSSVVPGLPPMWDRICAKAMAKDRQNRYATAAEFRNDILSFMNGGVPVAAAFNPLTDLSNVKARKAAEDDAYKNGTAPTTATQTFNPITGQFERVTPSPLNNPTAVKSRAEQRAAAAKTKRRKQIIIGSVIGILALLAIILGIAFAIGNPKNNTTEMVTVPTFNATMSKDTISAKLKALGLTMVERQDTDSTEKAGTFTDQDPEGGTSVEKGSKVEVWFSAGPQSVPVPDVKDKSQEEARQELEDAGFTVSSSIRTEDSDTISKDMVTRTDPAIGSSQPKGTSITIYVSSGMTKVPDNLVGQTQDAAQKSLTDRGFSVVIQSETSNDVAAGSVSRVEPGSGTSVMQGSTITIWVSSGKSQVAVPSVTGWTFSQAKAQLESLGFKVTQSGSSGNSDIVLSTNPASGTMADEGATITVTTQSSSTTEPTPTPTPTPDPDSGSDTD
ncbi:Stk1 family PASTA domain-containing Ser/Thr kinase [Bifidobacterium oedipodis]|uniref:non-specific serine/threonine protein kinase n=1 Tax=Bifidobacterium oedipodis TaxID=2675322 RepID=A0A7Y0ESV0_9BIFI|nr:Stk1 family PASTA domain-containing Ser/Thr kinase [Bifidobacterium sp. DSM 109957]NMM94721.1 serine/threonine protein kinase [Bifidobacterium sp. DSM 109957]